MWPFPVCLPQRGLHPLWVLSPAAGLIERPWKKTACHPLVFLMFSLCLCTTLNNNLRLNMLACLEQSKWKCLILLLGQLCLPHALQKIFKSVSLSFFFFILHQWHQMVPLGFGAIVRCPWTVNISFKSFVLITVSFEAIVNLLSFFAKADAFSLLQARINPQKEAES